VDISQTTAVHDLTVLTEHVVHWKEDKATSSFINGTYANTKGKQRTATYKARYFTNATDFLLH
jgi:hypothetical protein